MKNGIRVINPIKDRPIIVRDILSAILVDCGAQCSGYHDVEYSTYTDKWEAFNPARVKDYEVLPHYWKMVYDMHYAPTMGDCRDLKYRYVHCPQKILCRYPKVPCAGIFCITNKSIRYDRLVGNDLIYIGNEFHDE